MSSGPPNKKLRQSVLSFTPTRNPAKKTAGSYVHTIDILYAHLYFYSVTPAGPYSGVGYII